MDYKRQFMPMDWDMELLTLEDGTDLPPGRDASLVGVLTKGCLQEEDGNATGKKEDEVRDKEGPCG